MKATHVALASLVSLIGNDGGHSPSSITEMSSAPAMSGLIRRRNSSISKKALCTTPGSTLHAAIRAEERGLERADLRAALISARTCRAQQDQRWLVEGNDRDGNSISLSVCIEDGVLVITVF